MKCDGFEHACDSDEAERYRMGAAYVNNESNYMNLCKECQEDCDVYWTERWKDYYNSQGM